MSQRFIRCPHCGLPHRLEEVVCPSTGLALPKPRSAPPAVSPREVTHRRDLLGRTIDGKYRFISVLGEGGMGTVFEAENVALGRVVAVKVLHPSQAKKRVAVKRFHQEARAAGKIGHPNICEVYDLGTLTDGAPYLVMEKLVGTTLAERIAHEGGLPFEEVVDIVSQVLSGLIAAHEKGIVHRDIKPENVFLTERVGCPPVAKILDFGVSKMISAQAEEELDLTRTGMVMGTPFYMSPEQARGDRNLDARVDVWACGIMLYEALTGRRPFIASNYNALLLQILTATPRAVRELRPATPEPFDAVVSRALARNRDDRYSGATEFQRDLLAIRSPHFDMGQAPPMRPVRPAVRVPGPVPLVPSRVPSSSRPQVAPPPPVPASSQRAISSTQPRASTPASQPHAAAPSASQPRAPTPVSSQPRASQTRSSHPPPRSNRPPESDPLARLPSLEARYDEDDDAQGTSGTHFALDLVESGEMGGTDPSARAPEAAGFDEMPTEVVRTDWEDETTRRPLEAAASLRRNKSKPNIRPNAPSVEDTVKIEGDVEAHFARMHPAEEKPRAPGPRRRR